MGAWGGLCIFDYSRYTQAVVPAFRTGEAHPLIQQTLRIKQSERPQPAGRAFRGLAHLAAACDPMLTTCELGRVFSVCDGVISSAQPPSHPCVDHWDYEDVADLFERVVTRYAITHYTILGLAFTAVRHLFPPELGLDQRTQMLVEALDNRCEYWAAGTGGYGEGIRGWLEPHETAQLLAGLAPVASREEGAPGSDSPRIEPLFAYCGESEAEYARHMHRLSQFMAVLRQAHTLGQGVLWGRDLRLFYSAEGLFMAEEARPLELA